MLHEHRWGHGPKIVLVHGWVLGGREAWRAQHPLTERWTLIAPDMPGHGASPPGRHDAERYAVAIRDQLLEQPVHLVGHSYGAIVAMLAAAARPNFIRSLTVVEPPATRTAIDDPDVRRFDAEVRRLCADPGEDLVGLLQRFFAVAGVPVEISEPLPPPLELGARAIPGARPPGDVEIPLARLARAPFPMLVVTGGHLRAFEVIGDAIATATGAERRVVRGAGHLVPNTGPPFNELLESFLSSTSVDPQPGR